MNISNRTVQGLTTAAGITVSKGTCARRVVRRTAAIGGALALFAALAVPAPGAWASSSVVNWPSYLDGVSHHSYAAQATAITPSNAASLTEAWHFMPGAPPVKALGYALNASPTVYDGMVYIGGNNGTFYALNESTGAVDVEAGHRLHQGLLRCPGHHFHGHGRARPCHQDTDRLRVLGQRLPLRDERRDRSSDLEISDPPAGRAEPELLRLVIADRGQPEDLHRLSRGRASTTYAEPWMPSPRPPARSWPRTTRFPPARSAAASGPPPRWPPTATSSSAPATSSRRRLRNEGTSESIVELSGTKLSQLGCLATAPGRPAERRR